MNKVRVFHLDDDSKQLAYFGKIARNSTAVELIGSSSNYMEAFEAMHSLKPDLLFLDIEMPEISGFEFIRRLNGLGIKTVLLTNHDNYAVEAFKNDCLHYIQKPITKADLEDAVIKYIKSNTDTQPKAAEVVSPLPRNKQKLMINTVKAVEFVDLNNIVYIYSQGPYSHFVLLDTQAEVISSKHLKYYEDLLAENENFRRVHKSYIINKQLLKRIIKSETQQKFIFEKNHEITVATSKKDGWRADFF
jgi:two-component system, LytTR family, response regulator